VDFGLAEAEVLYERYVVMSVKLEAGNWYRTRGGEIVYCVAKHPIDVQYPFLVCFDGKDDRDDFESYTIDGIFSEIVPTNRDIIEHLPDCDGFDWVPPKLQLREGAWYERKDGKIVGPCKVDAKQPNKYGYKWCVGAWRYRDDGTNAMEDTEHLICEVNPPAPKYRPFANAEEFKPHRDRWIVDKMDGELLRCVKVFSGRASMATIYGCISMTDAFNRFEFEDGTPFGVLDQ